ncbi:hypothetical protein MHUMG1_04017 [Metarhizium humberi]|uniref:Uncharacterized protein n=1 Tax=Metarhizium humberi TaxID=2596975 RepID=A0A9P8S9R3_9HYPO|nr:hypothetical protein MHUMG1_04017 [Metarhizium humberi]
MNTIVEIGSVQPTWLGLMVRIEDTFEKIGARRKRENTVSRAWLAAAPQLLKWRERSVAARLVSYRYFYLLKPLKTPASSKRQVGLCRRATRPHPQAAHTLIIKQSALVAHKRFCRRKPGELIGKHTGVTWTSPIQDILPEYQPEQSDLDGKVALADFLSHRTGLSGDMSIALQDDLEFMLAPFDTLPAVSRLHTVAPHGEAFGQTRLPVHPRDYPRSPGIDPRLLSVYCGRYRNVLGNFFIEIRQSLKDAHLLELLFLGREEQMYQLRHLQGDMFEWAPDYDEQARRARFTAWDTAYFQIGFHFKDEDEASSLECAGGQTLVALHQSQSVARDGLINNIGNNDNDEL